MAAFISKKDMTRYLGEPCDHYCQGCAVCDGWMMWSDMTGDVINYIAHDSQCECVACKEEN